MRKFARRHRVALVTGSLMLATLYSTQADGQGFGLNYSLAAGSVLVGGLGFWLGSTMMGQLDPEYRFTTFPEAARVAERHNKQMASPSQGAEEMPPPAPSAYRSLR